MSRIIIQTRAMATGVATIDMRKAVRIRPRPANSRLKMSASPTPSTHWMLTPAIVNQIVRHRALRKRSSCVISLI